MKKYSEGDPCPDCGKPMEINRGYPVQRNHQAEASIIGCSDCGNAYFCGQLPIRYRKLDLPVIVTEEMIADPFSGIYEYKNGGIVLKTPEELEPVQGPEDSLKWDRRIEVAALLVWIVVIGSMLYCLML